MNSDRLLFRKLKDSKEMLDSLIFLSKIFYEKEHLMLHDKISEQDILTYYSSIMYAYLENDNCYAAYLNNEIKGAIIAINYNNPALYEFEVPKSLQKFDSFWDKAIEINSPYLTIDRCITLMCLGSSLKGVGKALMSVFFEEFEKQSFFCEVYIEASNPITTIITSKILEGNKNWEMKIFNEMLYDQTVKVEFILCRFLKNVKK